MTAIRKALECSIVAVASVAAFLLAGCEPAALDGPVAGKGAVVVSLASPATKGQSVPDYFLPSETRLDAIDLLVYQNGEKVYGERFTSTNNGTLTVTLDPGTYDICVVANAKTFDPKTFSTYAALKSKPITLQDAVPGAVAGNSGIQGMLMSGRVTSVTCVAGETTTTTVPVERYAARVRLVTVTSAFADTPLAGSNPKLGGVWLENVRSAWSFDKTGSATGLVLPAGRLVNGTDAVPQPTSGNPAPLAKAGSETYPYLYADYVSGQAFSGSWMANQEITINAVMFCLPNALAESGDHYGPTTADCRTRLVVDLYTGSDWATYRYYPITIDNPQAGWTYDVRMTFTGRGSTDPNDKLQRDAGLTVNIEAWKAGSEFDSYRY